MKGWVAFLGGGLLFASHGLVETLVAGVVAAVAVGLLLAAQPREVGP